MKYNFSCLFEYYLSYLCLQKIKLCFMLFDNTKLCLKSELWLYSFVFRAEKDDF